MTKAVSYMRCSGRGQVSGDTWDRQREAILDFTSKNNYEIIREYRDEAISGTNDEELRPNFQLMVADLLSNGCRTVIVENLDRFARLYDVQQQLATYLASKKIDLISAMSGENITAALMGNPIQRALVQLQGVISELEKNMLVAKLRKARERKRNSGQRCEGKKPFGHSNYPQELPTLNRIMELSKETQSLTQIALKLKNEGLSTRSGKPWSHITLSRIIKRAS